MARLDALDNALEKTLSGGSKVTPSFNASDPASSQLTELSTEEAEAAEHQAVEYTDTRLRAFSLVMNLMILAYYSTGR